MKKFFAFTVSVVLALCGLFAFACDGEKTVKTLSVYAPDGAPALAIAKSIRDGEDFGTGREVSYTVVSANDIGPAMVKGEGDIIVMPVNAATKLYNFAGGYAMAGIVTHGNLYIMSSKPITVESLSEEQVGVIGQGLVPDLTFRAVMNKKGATVGGITYYNTASDLIPMLKTDRLSVGLLPEPAATQLTKVASEKTWYRLDLQELYDGEAKSYPQAVVMVKKSVISECPDLIGSLGEKISVNAEWLTDNTADAVNAVNGALKEGVTPSLNANNITAQVAVNCKIYWQSATDGKAAVTDYMRDITALEPSAGVIPPDGFFCGVGA